MCHTRVLAPIFIGWMRLPYQHLLKLGTCSDGIGSQRDTMVLDQIKYGERQMRDYLITFTDGSSVIVESINMDGAKSLAEGFEGKPIMYAVELD